MIGHSVGPFRDPQFNQLANYVFGHCDALILRESVSLDMMKRSEIDTTKVEHGVDTARLVDHQDDSFRASYAVQHWLDVAASRKPSPLPCVNLRRSINASARPGRRTRKPLPRW